MALLDRFRTARPAWEDPDPAVRAEAVRSLRAEDAELIAVLLKNDADASVRRAALKKTGELELVLQAARADADAAVREEAGAILLRTGEESRDERKALAAAAFFGDARSLATLARGAVLLAVREDALRRIADERTLALVAKTADDPGIRAQALARVSDASLRADIALRSEHKDVAVAALDGVSDAAVLGEVATHARAKAAARRAQGLLDERQARTAPPEPAPVVSEPEADESPEERARREAYEHAVLSREALLARALSIGGDGQEAQLADAEAAWGRVPPLEGPQAVALEERFRSALAAVREGVEAARRREMDQAQASREAERLEREKREQAQQRERRQAERARQSELAERAKLLAKADAPALRDVERAMREIRMALQEDAAAAGAHEHEGLLEKLKHARAALYPRLQELREADEWKRWANTQVQEELVARMEALVAAVDLDKASLELRELNERWRLFSQARKQDAEALWTRFKTAREALQARLEPYFKQKADEAAARLRQLQTLAEKAEALATSTDWLKTADAIKALQTDWKAVGAVPRREQRKLWDRFHAACDRFFTARKQNLLRRRDEWAQNLVKKEALIAQAAALVESVEWEATAAEIKRLQAEWKAIGPVKKAKADDVWQRFKGVCDAFYERYKNRDAIASEHAVQAREAVVVELQTLASSGEGMAPPDDLASRVQDVLTRWKQAPSAGGAAGARLEERLSAARDLLIERWPAAFQGTDLDPEASRARREKLVVRAEALVAAHAAAGGASETASLADRLREALATNAMGGRAALEARWREAARELEQLQAGWKRLGPVTGEAGRALAERFKKAGDALQAKKPR